jgi:hypothetical protein
MSLIRQAAQGTVVHNDDTSMRALRLKRDPSDERTGVFTSGIVSVGQDWKIALYFTGGLHAGENIWIDQCAATEDIRDNFGPHSALDYLIGEKLFSFLRAAERDPLFAAEVPDFIREIRRLFAAEVIRDYLDRLEKTNYLAPSTPISKWTSWTNSMIRTMTSPSLGENPVMGAEELLRFSRVRQLLQS